MGSIFSLLFSNSHKRVVVDLNDISLDKCNILNGKESATVDSSPNVNLGTSLKTETGPLEEENDMELIKDNDPSTSLRVQDSPVGSASATPLNKVYSAKKMKKRKGEWTLHEDKVSKALCTSGLLHDGFTKVQIEQEKCNASTEVKTEVLLTNCKKEASPLLPGCIVEDITSSDPGGHGISLQTLDNPFLYISASGCSHEELALMRKNIIKKAKLNVLEVKSGDDMTIYDPSPEYLLQKNGDVLGNLQTVVPDGGIILEVNLESCPNDCQSEAKNNRANGGYEQDTLFQVSISPDRTPVTCTQRKLLILDVNGLLVDVVTFQSNFRKPDAKVSGRSVYKRPFCDDFLKFCFEKFDVGVWSSRMRKNLLAVVNLLFGDEKNKLFFCWDQSHCTITGFRTIENGNKPLFLKELKKLWDKEEPDLPWQKGDYTPSNTLLLDDSPYKALRNPPYTAVFPSTYSFKDINDDSLGPGGDLRVYLEGLVKSDDVPRYVQEHPFGQHAITGADPSWPFYLKVIGVENSLAAAL